MKNLRRVGMVAALGLGLVGCGGEGLDYLPGDASADVRRDARVMRDVRDVAKPEAATVDIGCPATYAEASHGGGARLCSAGLACGYREGSCECTPPCGGAKSAQGTWTCSAPRTDGCPVNAPIAGGSCTQGLSCSYGTCCVQPFNCPNGTWLAGPQSCP